MTSVFFAFRDSPQRRRALLASPGSSERYLLFGLDELRARGHSVTHSLEPGGRPPRWTRAGARPVKWWLEHAGGYGGDFSTVFASLRAANRADVVFSTVDTVGIPLALLKRFGWLRPPFVYTAVGLPEQLSRLRGARMRRLYASALASTASIVTYSESEADELARWLAAEGSGARIEFVPFGVDAASIQPTSAPATFDVVSVGADPQRDFDLLLRVAGEMPEASFRIVLTTDRLQSLGPTPANVSIDVDVPFDSMLATLRLARVVALPVRDNSYSGATTVLLQSMALGKPIVVSRTRAIAQGYGLVDGENCRLVPPGDAVTFARALDDVLRDDELARALGACARRIVEQELTWEAYVNRVEGVLVAAGASAGVGSRSS